MEHDFKKVECLSRLANSEISKTHLGKGNWRTYIWTTCLYCLVCSKVPGACYCNSRL